MNKPHEEEAHVLKPDPTFADFLEAVLDAEVRCDLSIYSRIVISRGENPRPKTPQLYRIYLCNEGFLGDPMLLTFGTDVLKMLASLNGPDVKKAMADRARSRD